jgi:hypothetical protein
MDNGMPWFPIIVFLSVCVLIWKAIKDAKSRRFKENYLKSVGFEDCPEKKKELIQAARYIVCADSVPEKRFRIDKPKRVVSNGEEIFSFVFSEIRGSVWDRSRTIIRWEMFIFPFERATEDAVSFYLTKPSTGSGLKKVGGFIAGITWGIHMNSLEIPPDLKGSSIMAVYGQNGGKDKLYDLVDHSTISAVQEGIHLGAGAFCARGKMGAVCMETSVGFVKPEMISQLWPYVQRVAKMS